MKRLAKFRSHLKNLGIDAFIIPTKDAHNSEYIAGSEKRREYITHFSGSAGSAVVMADKACLWVDGRYWTAAEKQTDADLWRIQRMGERGVPEISEWLELSLIKDQKVGIDPFLLSVRDFRNLKDKLRNLQLVSVKDNPVDFIWEDRPPRPAAAIFLHPLEFSGKLASDKIYEVRKSIQKVGCETIIITALDQIAWLLNLRGADIDYNPLFYAYCVLSQTDVALFVDERKINEEVRKYLLDLNVKIMAYEDILSFAKSQGESLKSAGKKVFLTPSDCNYAIFAELASEVIHEDELSPVELHKAKKNAVELDGMRMAHIRDGAAKTAWLAWLEEKADAGDENVTEISAADELQRFRKKQENLVGLSFESISASGANAAQIHYKPSPLNDSVIDFNKMYLIDSGGQYREGTTDVTRTVHMRQPTDEERRLFTLVLKGHIALAKAVFPENISGSYLDVLARQYLWEEGKNYNHGTGHGVGSFLNVHEGPQNISAGKKLSAGLVAGMVLSNEPGYYEVGKLGIRIESVMIVKPSKLEGFLQFETVTMVPIQRKLIENALLTKAETKWLNEYHKNVLEKLSPLFQDDKRALNNLKRECEEIGLN